MLDGLLSKVRKHPLASLVVSSIITVSVYKIAQLLDKDQAETAGAKIALSGPSTSRDVAGTSSSNPTRDLETISQQESLKLMSILGDFYRTRDAGVFEQKVQSLTLQEQQKLTERMLSQGTFYLTLRHIKAFNKMQREEFVSLAFSKKNQMLDADVRSALEGFISAGFRPEILIEGMPQDMQAYYIMKHLDIFFGKNTAKRERYIEERIENGDISSLHAFYEYVSENLNTRLLEKLNQSLKDAKLEIPGSPILSENERRDYVSAYIKHVKFADVAGSWDPRTDTDIISAQDIRTQLIASSDYASIIKFAEKLGVLSTDIPQYISQFVSAQLPLEPQPKTLLSGFAEVVDQVDIPASSYKEIVGAFDKYGNIAGILFSQKLTDYYIATYGRDALIRALLNEKDIHTLVNSIDKIRPTQQQAYAMLDFVSQKGPHNISMIGSILRYIESLGKGG